MEAYLCASSPPRRQFASVCPVASPLCLVFLSVSSVTALQLQPQSAFPSGSYGAARVPGAYISVSPSSVSLSKLSAPSSSLPRSLFEKAASAPSLDARLPAAAAYAPAAPFRFTGTLSGFGSHAAFSEARGEPSCLSAQASGTAASNAQCADAEEKPTPLALTLRSYLRCHMSLLSDASPAFSNGNLMFLYRAADAHERLISPLELHTNSHHLPGAEAARVMATFEPEALEAAVPPEADKEKPPQDERKVFARELLKFEVRRLHRLLQFACAGELRGEILNRDSTKVMFELLQEAGLPLSSVLEAFDRMNKFYEKKMPAAAYKTHYMPSLDSLKSQLLDIQKAFVAEEKAVTSRHVLSEVTFEPEPDPRTLTPLLLDITTMGDTLPGVAAWNKKA
ncbi:hypothetical protein BESB_079750 [Besnoitia besnoiti]|uniref:Uncharacterized protein n=1 Tax=Besnoitia besnoiti TaxID=94643 RepID=A0A2A9M734_BESBE|nr:hypothetical protein BESB_079750 [Besnoitia besnoiti]PFH33759.1 hypothetical protein BESB_079750 [Besnoitia besnoiti]